MTLSPIKALKVLHLLDDAAVAREHELDKENPVPIREDADEENESLCPLLGASYGQRSIKAIFQMINFDPRQFEIIWIGFQSHIKVNFCNGRGRKNTQTAKVFLFMTLSVLKHEGQRDFMAKAFGMKTFLSEWLVVNFMYMFSDTFYDQYLEYYAGNTR